MPNRASPRARTHTAHTAHVKLLFPDVRPTHTFDRKQPEHAPLKNGTGQVPNGARFSEPPSASAPIGGAPPRRHDPVSHRPFSPPMARSVSVSLVSPRVGAGRRGSQVGHIWVVFFFPLSKFCFPARAVGELSEMRFIRSNSLGRHRK